MSAQNGPSDEKSLMSEFLEVEKLVDDLEAGNIESQKAQDQVSKGILTLESLMEAVRMLDLFSDNESYDELPTGSLSFMLIPCYLGILTQKVSYDQRTPDTLKRAKQSFLDFLKKIRMYAIADVPFPFVSDESGATKPLPADAQRIQKIERFKKQKEMEALVATLRAQRQRDSDDDSVVRDLVLAQIRYWAYKAVDEILAIDQELPMLEHMMKIRSGEVKPEAPKAPPVSSKPFIITKSEEQKKVFGLGYPAIPVQTVDEWYDEQTKKGRFPGPQQQAATASGDQSQSSRLSDSENEDDERDEERRAAAMRWDEYKDTHRRGWGNTHNKG